MPSRNISKKQCQELKEAILDEINHDMNMVKDNRDETEREFNGMLPSLLGREELHKQLKVYDARLRVYENVKSIVKSQINIFCSMPSEKGLFD
jgi:hypothetical protein